MHVKQMQIERPSRFTYRTVQYDRIRNVEEQGITTRGHLVRRPLEVDTDGLR